MRIIKTSIRTLIIAALMAGGLLPFAARTATVTGFSDTMSNLAQGVVADHRILFVSAAGVDASTDTIAVAFGATGSFDLSTVTPADVDLGYDTSAPTNDCAGTFSDKSVATTPAAGVWGASVTGQTLTLTAPSDAAIGEVPAGRCIRILIGKNATYPTTGIHQITNPATTGAQTISLAGTFGDAGTAYVTIIPTGDVQVTAIVENNGGGGGGGGGDPINPPTIINVRVTNLTETTADVLWETDVASSSDVNYGTTVAYGSTTTGSGSTFNHTVHLTGLTAGTLYHYRVRSTGVGTPEAVSSDNTFTTPDTTQPVISNIQIINITGTTARITWDTNEDATSIVNYGFIEPYAWNANTPGLTNSHVVDLSGLTPNTTYRFRVTSADAAGNPTTSVELSFVTLDTVPPVISNVTVDQITTTSARINWQTNELATSNVTYGTTTAYGTTTIGPGPVANHQVTLTGLSPQTLYNFLVSSSDAAGNSASSTNATFTTLPDTTAPANVIGLVATGGLLQVTLAWTLPSDPDFAGVMIRRSLVGYPTSPTQGTLVYDGPGTSTTDTTATVGVQNYYTAFAYDTSHNYASGATASAIPYDLTPPSPPTNFVVVPGPQQNSLTWTNPTNTDFSVVVVCRSTTAYPSDPTACSPIYTGTGQTRLDSGLTDGTLYYYTVWARDTSGNYSTGVYGTGRPTSVYCGNGVCDPGENHGLCREDCGPGNPPDPICGDGACTSGENRNNCPADCGAPPPPPPGPVCGDSVCDPGETYGTCSADCPAPPPPPPPPVVVPPTTSPIQDRIRAEQIVYTAMERSIVLQKDAQGNLHDLPGHSFSVIVPVSALPVAVKTLTLNLGEGSYLFKRDERVIIGVNDSLALAPPPDRWFIGAAQAAEVVTDAYVVDLQSPVTPQTVKGTVIALFENGTTDIAEFGLRVEPYGYVYEMKDGSEVRLSGATVTLQKNIGGTWMGWNELPYHQNNPLITPADGIYGYVVPDNTYRLEVSKTGYRTKTTAPFAISVNVVNEKIELISEPKPILEVIVPGAPLTENIYNVAKGVTDQTIYVTKILQQEIILDPRVETVATRYVGPATVAMTGIVIISAVRAVNIASYFYYFLSQPFLLFWLKRRKEYGVVYTSLSRQPVDLAAVRLFRTNGKLVRTIVTDKRGRYSFLVDEGEYRMEVTKQGLAFPSEILKERREDRQFLDLYHGEVIKVDKNGSLIAANIPLDSIEETKSTRRMILDAVIAKFQDVLGFASSLVALALFALYRTPYYFVLALVQVGLYFVFRRLARPPKPKNWGIIYDETTKKPVPFAVARIVESEYQKVLESRVTDSRGRYNFLVGNSRYFVTVEKPGYETTKTLEIDLTGKKEGEGVIGMDIGIKPISAKPDQPPKAK